jgi:ligand-binding sensor domain-containing protein
LLDVYAEGLSSVGENKSSHYIHRWLALVFIEGETAPKAIETDYLLEATGTHESEFATLAGTPKAGDIMSLTLEGYATQERIWKVLSLPENGDVNEMFAVEGDIDNAVAYLLTFIESEEASKRELRIGSDDTVKVWLNGEVVHTVSTARALSTDQDRVTVDLRKGMNCLMVKVAESFGDWQVTVRFHDISGLRFFDTPGRELVPLGKQLIRLPNPQLEPPVAGVWKTYRYLDGLASNWTNDILQDEEGVMWFGTNAGVSKFDGRSWTTYTQEDGLTGNNVYAVIQDRKEAIWVGTGGGVSSFDGESWKTYTQKDGLAGNNATAIMEDKEGVLWIGTDAGISRFDGKIWNTYTQRNGLAADDIHVIMQDREGIIWSGTDDGVSSFDGENWETYTQEDGLAGSDVRSIMQDKEGTIWVGTGGGVSKFDGENWRTYTQRNGLAAYWVNDILQDEEGGMWFGTSGGVSRFDGRSWRTYTQKEGLAGNNIYTILQDKEGMIWFGTSGGGVSRFDRKSWRIYTQRDGLATNDVRIIIQDKEGTVWAGIGGGGGVCRFDGKRWETYTSRHGLAGGDVYAIIQDKEGMMWFGTDLGVSRFDGKTWENHWWGNWVRAILQDKEGSVWFGTGDGLRRFDGNSWETYTRKDGLADNRINAVIQGEEGAIWFGTDGGVSRFDGESWKTYTRKDGLADNRINAVIQDEEGVIWFGTDSGVSRFDGESWKTYTRKDGLADNRVNAIMQEEDGVIWFGTSSGGASRFDGRCFQTLDSRDGLVKDTVYSIYMDRSGRIWIGTMGGAVQFTPSMVPPTVHITEMIADETYANPEGVIQLRSDVRRISVSYRAISFKTRPGGTRYFHQLVGQDTDWRGPINQETVDYLNLKHGEYTFKVQAVDRDLNYSEVVGFNINIPPPFHIKAVFLVPTVTLGAGLLATLVILATGLIKHRRQVRAYERLAARELQDAREVQMFLLPKNAPPVEGVEIAGKCVPANTVGGDFLDYLEGRDNTEVALVIADVTGKAMRGAMNAAMTDGVLRAIAKEEFTPASLMAKLNDVLKDRTQSHMYVTMQIGIIDTDIKTLTLANAGHHALPILLRNGEIQTLMLAGFPLGMIPESIEYDEEQFQLESGDVVVLMTDGIIETQDGEGKPYSESGRLQETISGFTADMSAEAMVGAIIADAMDFGGGRDTRDDDMTVVVAKVL